MKKLNKFLIGIISSLSCLFIGVGYAKMTDNFKVSGDIKAQVQEGVFICNVKSSDNKSVINHYVSSTLNSTVTLDNSASSTAYVEITVFNNAAGPRGYNAVKYMVGETTYSNENIVFEVGLERRTEIKVGEYLTFGVTFSYKDKKVSSNNVLNSILNFEFVPLDQIPEDEEEIAVHGALDRFEEILNTPNEAKELTDQMDKNDTNDRYDNSYIGNVVGASEADVILLERLFVGNLHININGKDTEVTVMIKRENLDGNTSTGDENGNEMTVYLTTDNLERDSWWSAGTAPVFAAVFTKTETSDKWTQIGEMVEGTATVKGYDGNVFGEGSFDTDTWKSLNNQTIEQVVASFL